VLKLKLSTLICVKGLHMFMDKFPYEFYSINTKKLVLTQCNYVNYSKSHDEGAVFSFHILLSFCGCW
jgi:hypothetical protein